MSGTTWRKSGFVFSVALLTAGWLAAGPAAAQNGKGKARGQNNGKGGNAQIVHELRQTRTLLQKADHDYKGHRAAAVREITKAIHLLQQNKPRSQQAGKSGRAKGLLAQAGNTGNRNAGRQTNREPQGVSDHQLRRAIHQLRQVAQQLEHRGNGQHHRQALHHVRRAIQDLEKALTVA